MTILELWIAYEKWPESIRTKNARIAKARLRANLRKRKVRKAIDEFISQRAKAIPR